MKRYQIVEEQVLGALLNHEPPRSTLKVPTTSQTPTNPAAQLQQRYFSLNQTAKYLGLSAKVLYTWVERKRVPAYKLGGVWRFDIEEVDRLVKEGLFVSLKQR